MGQHPKKLELSWHKPSKQWRKRHKGKEYYLGTGNGKTDAASYQRALERWRQKKTGLDTQEHSERLASDQGRYEAWGKQLACRPGIDPSIYTGGTIDLNAEVKERSETHYMTEIARLFHAAGWKPSGAATEKSVQFPTIGKLVTLYLQRREVLSTSGQRSLGRYENLRKGLSEFRDWVGADAVPSIINSQLLGEFHTLLLTKVTRKQMGEVCAKSRMQILRQFLNWAWENEYIDLPRNIKSKDLEVAVTAGAVKAMSVADFQTLYNAANERTKLFLLLMANCGMTQKDISDLKQTEVDWAAGRIIRKRSKTKKHEDVPVVNYKLWPETFSLLKAHRSNDAVIVLVNKTGLPLVRDFLKTDATRPEPYLVRVNSISYAYERLREGLKPAQMISMKYIRKTGTTLISRKFPWLRKLYLGHSARSIDEKHYLADEDNRLDEALDWLKEQLFKQSAA